jgi:hypothetical protein
VLERPLQACAESGGGVRFRSEVAFYRVGAARLRLSWLGGRIRIPILLFDAQRPEIGEASFVSNSSVAGA